jgi:hypothetical protein
MEIKKAALEIVAQSIDLKKLASGIVDQVVEEAIKKAVAKSATPLDDMAVAALWPVVEKELKDLIEEKLDLKKILGIE